MRIRFTRNVWLNKDDRAKAPSFPEGSSHDMNAASAYRWVRRNVAVYIVEEAVVPLKMDRPMMGDVKKFSEEMLNVDLIGIGKMAAEIASPESLDDKPKKRGRKPKKALKPMPKGDTTVREIVTGPALPVKGSGI